MTETNIKLKKEALELIHAKVPSIPDKVYNAIDDAFEEVDFDESISDSVNVYGSDEFALLLSDIDIHTYLEVSVNSLSNGDVSRKYTYYGKMDAKYDEDIRLVDGTDVMNLSKTSVGNNNVDRSQWLVVVVSTNKFYLGKMNTINRIYIYVPEKLNNDSNIKEDFLND